MLKAHPDFLFLQTPGRVFKGKKMPGNMGNAKRTIKNLMVFKVDPHNELVYVKGAVPGAAKTWLRMYDSENSEFYFQTPPYPVYKPNPEEIQPTEIRHHYDWLPPHFWARNDTTDPERLEILRAERLGQIFSEVNQPQTMSEIIQVLYTLLTSQRRNSTFSYSRAWTS